MNKSTHRNPWPLTVCTLLCITLLLLPGIASSQACNGDLLFRDGGTGFEFPGTAATDNSGTVYSTGYYSEATTFGGTPLTSGNLPFGVYLACHDANGQVRYARTLMSSWSSFFVPPRIVKSGNYLYILARNGGDSVNVQGTYYQRDRFTRSYVLMQTDLNGTLRWHHIFSYNDQLAATVGVGLTADDKGNVYIGGTFSDTLRIGGNLLGAPAAISPMGFLAKLDNTGNVLWARQTAVSNPSFVYLRSLNLTSNGLVVGAGMYHKDVTFGTHTGGATNTAPNAGAPFAVAFDTTGSFAWLNAATETAVSASIPLAAATDAAGNTYATGFITDTVDFGGGNKVIGQEDMFLVKYGPAGNVVWVKTKSGHVGNDLESGYAITVTPGDRIVVAGIFTDSTYFGTVRHLSVGAQDFFLAWYDNSGTLIRAATYGSPGNDEPDFVLPMPNDSLITGGYFVGPSLTINSHTITRSGTSGTDLFWYDQCVLPLSITSPTAGNTMVVYPNPASNELHIAFPEAGTSAGELNVIDITGKLVTRASYSAGTKSAVLSTQMWARGTYMIVLTLNGRPYRQLLTHL